MIRTLLVILLLAAPATAEPWRTGAFDNGAWFEAYALSPDQNVTFHCGGASPGGRPLPASDAPRTTLPYEIALGLYPPIVRRPPIDVEMRTDLMVVIGSTGYRLPGASWNLVEDDHYEQPLQIGDPLVAALRSAPAFAVDAGAQRLAVLGGEGLGAALDRAIAYCVRRWSATRIGAPAASLPYAQALLAANLPDPPGARGVPAPPVPAVPPAAAAAPRPRLASPVPTGQLEAMARSYYARDCGTAAIIDPAGYIRGDIDGDGAEDLLVDTAGVTCVGMGHAFCGSAGCSGTAFLTSQKGPAGDFFGQGMSLVRGTGRGLHVAIGHGHPSDCGGQPPCTSLFEWDGTAFRQLPTP